MQTAKLFKHNGSQAVRLSKEFWFSTSEVIIRKEGNEVILSPRFKDLSDYIKNGPVASKEFMTNVEDLPPQERAMWSDSNATKPKRRKVSRPA